jgi:adenosylcobinamide amidohydrolase
MAGRARSARFPDPQLHLRREDGAELAGRIWRLAEPLLAISSAPLGGGIGPRHWLLNAQVPRHYARRDPDRHLVALADAAGLRGPGIGMLTAVDVRRAVRDYDDGVGVDCTVGVTLPQWAAAADDPADVVGTVNIVAFLPERLDEAALVNAVGTVTEAKAQAFFECGLPGTGTASDAVSILCPAAGAPWAFGGPRSFWGIRLARAVHRAVVAGYRQEGPA